jgi:hypothetical protein
VTSIWKFNLILALVGTGAVAAQEAASADRDERRGWRRVGDSDQRDGDAAPPNVHDVPARVDVASGTFVSVRVDQMLSSDRNLAGDGFTATLAQPIVADGLVVARRGQTVAGRVAEAVRAGRRTGTSRLALEVTEVTFADGRQVPVTSQLMEYQGGTSVGRDATAVATTAGLGAAIGGAAAGGAAAGIGAGAGAAVALIGVLTTRGRPTEVYPEAELTFRLTNTVSLSTERSAHAFRPVRQEDYEQNRLRQRTAPATVYASDPYGWGPGWGMGPGWGWGRGWGWDGGWGWYGRPYWGPTVVIRTGPRNYGGFRGRRR